MRQIRKGQKVQLITDFRVVGLTLESDAAHCTLYQKVSPNIETEIVERFDFVLPVSIPAFKLGPLPRKWIHPVLLPDTEWGHLRELNEEKNIYYHPKTKLEGNLVLPESFWHDGCFNFVHNKVVEPFQSIRCPSGFDAQIMREYLTNGVLFRGHTAQGLALQFAVKLGNQDYIFSEDVLIGKYDTDKKRIVKCLVSFASYAEFFMDANLIV